MAKVLVVAPAWVGDMVMAHALVPGLVARGAQVHFLAPPSTAQLAERMPGVAATHRTAARRGRLDLRHRLDAAKRLRRHSFDQAIVLPGSFKSALTPALAGIPKRTGFRGEARFGLLNDMRRLDARAMPRLVDRFAALADTTPSPPRLRPDENARSRLLDALGVDLARPAVALCPGAEYGAAKRWPADHFAELAALCARTGASVWVLGGAADRGAATVIAERAPVLDLTGRTTLAEAVNVLSAAHGAVANDSGLMHLAGALDVPLVAVFGSTSPTFTPPLGERAAVVERQLPCRPCFARTCRLRHLDCLRGVLPARVFAELGGLGVFDAEPSAGVREGLAPRKKKPSAGMREGPAPRMKEPSAGVREGLAPRMKKPSAGVREGPAPRMKEPSAGVREGPAPRMNEPSAGVREGPAPRKKEPSAGRNDG